MRGLLKYMQKQDRLSALLALSALFVQVYLDLSLPASIAELTRMSQTAGTPVLRMLWTGGRMLLLSFGSFLSAGIAGYFIARATAGLSRELRERVFRQALSLSPATFHRFSADSLLTRTTNDVLQIQNFFSMSLAALVKVPIVTVWASAKIFRIGRAWTLLVGITVLLLLLLLGGMFFLALPRFLMIQRLTDRLNQVTREGIAGIRVLRSYSAEAYQQEKFERVNRQIASVHFFLDRLMAGFQPGMTFLLSALSVCVYWIGSFFLERTSPMVGMRLFSDMVVIMNYASQVVLSCMLLAMAVLASPRAAAAAKRLREVLEEEVEQDGRERAQQDQPGIEKGDAGQAEQGIGREEPEREEEDRDKKTPVLSFCDVSFRYPMAQGDALSGISFQVYPGETVAVIGGSGSGKSTLLQLPLRLYDVQAGQVFLDNADIRDYRLSALREAFSYVPQQPFLFSGTVASNVSFPGDAGLDMQEALSIAQAADFVGRLPEGRNAPVSQGGSNFSGGERQRLTIARALSRRPRILLLDDAFSALDQRTARRLWEALRRTLPHTAILFSTQRIWEARRADRIVLLSEGRLVSEGSHEELLSRSSLYQSMAALQLPGEGVMREEAGDAGA